MKNTPAIYIVFQVLKVILLYKNLLDEPLDLLSLLVLY